MEVDSSLCTIQDELQKIFISETDFFLQNFSDIDISKEPSNEIISYSINLQKDLKDNATNSDLLRTIFDQHKIDSDLHDVFDLFSETIYISEQFSNGQEILQEKLFYFEKIFPHLRSTLPMDIFYIFRDDMETLVNDLVKKHSPNENDMECCFAEVLLKIINEVILKNWVSYFVIKNEDKKFLKHLFNEEWIKKKNFEFSKPQLFTMLISFPESIKRLQDVKYSFTCVSVKIEAIDFLQREIEQRLTHTGVHTDEILISYESIILSLRFIDPTYITQVVVSKPIAEYLRTRSDAIKCIVERIWYWFSSTYSEDMDKMELGEESCDVTANSFPRPLSKQDLNSTSQNAVDSDDEFVYVDNHFVGSNFDKKVNYLKIRQEFHDKWKPEPIESICLATRSANKNLDLLSTMMSIYESKKDFLMEYMKQLANHLLKFTSFEDQRILFSKQLKLFKYRFSVLDLHFCDVMLQDVENSEDWFRQFTAYIDMNYTGSLDNEDMFPLKVLVISSFYWPELLDDNFLIPDSLLEPFKMYSNFFVNQNEEMRIKWLCRYGSVDVDLELPNQKTVSLSLEPIEASLINLFTKKNRISLAELSSELKASNLSTIKRALKVFLNNGILKMKKINRTKASNIMEAANSEIYEIVDNRYTYEQDKNDLANEKETTNDPQDMCTDLNNVNEQGVANNEENSIDEDNEIEEIELQKSEKDNKMYWSYVNGMLVNLGALSLDKMLTMLQVFTSAANESSAPINKVSLQAFLNKKIIENEINLEGGLYRLVKKQK